MSKYTFLSSLLILSFIIACNDDENDSSFEETKASAVSHYADLVYANYLDTYNDALALQTKIETFLATPSASSLAEAKEAWLNARESYGQTEAFRFYGGPIDDEDGPEGQLNAWPLDESYIDYVITDKNGEDPIDGTNIINSPNDFPSISAEVIASLNEAGGETNISSGYHAIEFLLWGQDLSSGPGGGERPFTDYVSGSNGTHENQDRRGIYLSEVTKLLISDLESLLEEWETSGEYRSEFTSTVDVSLENIVSALGKLSKGELAGERMYVAYDLRSKEDEHSCFSDNTHRDIVTNALGIQNVYLGKYGSEISGTGIYDVINLKDAALADEIKTLLESAVTKCEAIQAPFDQEFLNEEGRTRILSAINTLREIGDKMAEAGSILGFTFDPDDI
ncbi:MAG: imelysin family protein [Bacteroidota bacterium]